MDPEERPRRVAWTKEKRRSSLVECYTDQREALGIPGHRSELDNASFERPFAAPSRTRYGRWPWVFLATLAVFSMAKAEVPTANNTADNLPEAERFLYFKTEPTFEIPVLNMHTYPSAGRVSDEYIFTTLRSESVHSTRGPLIYDTNGELAFYSDNSIGIGFHDAHPCAIWTNETKPGSAPMHLCAGYVLETLAAHRLTIPRIYDNTYSLVEPSYKGIGMQPVEGHEFHVFPPANGSNSFATYISTVYFPRLVGDISINGAAQRRDAWVYDACFQEVGVYNKSVLFAWCGLNFMDVSETLIDLSLPQYEEETFEQAKPFDWAHINSVDKDINGDYLASLRHLNAIIKIAGIQTKRDVPPGTVLWRLGGKSSDFTFDPPESAFSRQHHARWLQSNEPSISLLDNHCMTGEDCHDVIAAKFFDIDESAKVARLTKTFSHPTGLISGSGGSVEILNNTNVAVSWGRGEVSEYNQTTQAVVMHAVADESALAYRSRRSRWNGLPAWRPKLLAYMGRCESSELNLYISWNGATPVKERARAYYIPPGIRKWSIATSRTGAAGSFWEIGQYDRTGFETHIKLSCSDISYFEGEQNGTTTPGCFPGYILAAAVGFYGGVERESNFAKVYVPSAASLSSGVCDETSCEAGFTYDETSNAVDACQASEDEVKFKSTQTHVESITIGPVDDHVFSWPTSLPRWTVPVSSFLLLVALCTAISRCCFRRRPQMRWTAVPGDEVDAQGKEEHIPMQEFRDRDD